MEFINTSIKQSARQIREKADQAVNDAIQEAAGAHQTLTRKGTGGQLVEEIRASQESMYAIAEKIAAVKNQIAAERKPIEEKLSEMQTAAARARAEVDNISFQIKAKEKEIDRLSKETHQMKDVWPLGKIRIPDPKAVAQAGALRVEVAGMHGAMATAQEVLARTTQALETLYVEAANAPIEADPRVMVLYKELEAEKNVVAALTKQALEAARKHLQEFFTTENRRKLAAMASKQMDTGLPDDVEKELFFDAIAKIEQAVMEAIPAKALAIMQDAGQGISGDTRTFETRLTKTINAKVDIPMLNETQEEVLFGLLIHVMVEAMKPEKTLDVLLSEA
jgi:hypothetical protein